ncbi:MAG: CBS domain-containing protein [Candidatus Bathyarchaeota archaeon]|nr:CBS domain-containing protein [Candidatus Bathyarchaeota archaeon]
MSLVVQNIMVSNVITTEKHNLVIDAGKIMNQHCIGCLVVMENGSPVGIVTERDLLKRVLGESKNPKKIRVQEIMSSPLIVGKPDMEIDEVTKLMFGRKIKKLPIVKDGKLVGLVTFTDLLSFQPSLIRVVKELTNPHSWKKTEDK